MPNYDKELTFLLFVL